MKRPFFLQTPILLFCLHILPIFPLFALDLLTPMVIAKLPHDRQAFTQGLALEGEQLYESTGLYAHSTLRQLDPRTGLALRRLLLPASIFAEGIAVFSDQIVQLTWREQRAFIYERPSWRLLRSIPYSGEGWGLCREGERLWMSNGSAVLTQRDRHTLEVTRTLSVTLRGEPLSQLNDLEHDGLHLYANVWHTRQIVRINPTTGEVDGILDASPLLSSEEEGLLEPEQVLNGIAFRPQTGTFFLTGKNWPWIFEVRFLCSGRNL